MNGSETNQILDNLRAVRQRWRLVTLVVILTTAVALGVSLSSKKQYDATAELLLRSQEPVNTLLNPNAGASSNDPERELNTDVRLIKVAATVEAVRRELHLRRSADDLLAQIKTDTSNASDIVTLTVRDRDPLLAARIANSFAEAYVRFRLNSARERYLEAAKLAQQQLLTLSATDRRQSVEGRQLQARAGELRIAAALQTGGAEIVRRASVASGPSRPRPKLSAALGLLLGLMLGVGVALVLNLIDRRFKDEQQIETFFDLPTLGAIPRPARRGADLDDPLQREAYGLLAANLPLNEPGQPGKVVMVTSPSPGDGKTSVTIGAARAFARFGLSVIAIESDLRRPTFTRWADLSASSGLAGVLEGSPLAGELVWIDANTLQPVENRETGAIGLLPAGELPVDPQRSLADAGMSRVVRTARALADIVLIDTAPAGTVNDAAMVGHLVDCVVLVTRLNQTTKDAGRRASRLLGNLGPDVLGTVVTDAGSGERHEYYSRNTPKEAAPQKPRSGVQSP